MPNFDLLRSFAGPAYSAAVESADYLERQLTTRYLPPGFPREEVFLEADLPRDLLDELVAEATPPGGVFGAGLITFRDSVRPAVFVLEGFAPLAGEEISKTLADRLVGSLTKEVPRETIAVGLPMPSEQFVAPGMRATSRGIPGTLGVKATDAQGRRSILTAGHVGRHVGSAVSVAGSRIGQVTFSDYLDQNPPGIDCADIAVVTLDVQTTEHAWNNATTVVSAQQHDALVAYGNRMQKGWVRAVVPSFAKSETAGNWGSCLITDRAISIGGDSGAPVLLDDASSSLVGHIVAGAVPAYSLVQDAAYQLQACRCTLREP